MALGVILCNAVLIEVISQSGYGEFKEKFKGTWPNYSYIAIYIIYQSFLGLYISLENEYEEATYLVIGFYLFYGLYFGVNLPFKDFYHNYRAGIILISQGCVLMATNYYRMMKSTTDNTIKARLHGLALAEIIMIVVSTVFSALVLSYDLYLWIKAKIQARKKL